MRSWDYLTLRCCSWFLDCLVTFCPIEEEEMRKQTNPREFSPDDVDMVNDEDDVVEIAKPYVREKRKCGSKTDEVKSTPSSKDVVVAPTYGSFAPTPSPASKATTLPPLVKCSLHFQETQKNYSE